jgi:hypothetical protein
MKKVYLDENVFYIENFLPTDLWQKTLDICKKEDGWKFEDLIVPQRGTKNMPYEIYQEYWDIVLGKLKEIYPESDHMYRYTGHFSAFKPANEAIADDWAFGLHEDDNGYKEGYKIDSENPVILHGCIYYINDDYDGGEVVYPRANLRIKPKPNMFLSHPGTSKYLHGVTQVYGKTRYTSPMFILDRKQKQLINQVDAFEGDD